MGRPRNWGYCKYCEEYTKIAARGMCHKHYGRWRRHRDISDPDYINKGKSCSVSGCESNAKMKGLCVKHYRRVEKYGDPHTLKDPDDYEKRSPYNKNQCIIPDCDEELEAKELCYKHYQNFMYHIRSKNVDNIFDYLRLRKDNPLIK